LAQRLSPPFSGGSKDRRLIYGWLSRTWTNLGGMLIRSWLVPME
jgi:hypothetical protein